MELNKFRKLKRMGSFIAPNVNRIAHWFSTIMLPKRRKMKLPVKKEIPQNLQNYENEKNLISKKKNVREASIDFQIPLENLNPGTLKTVPLAKEYEIILNNDEIDSEFIEQTEYLACAAAKVIQ